MRVWDCGKSECHPVMGCDKGSKFALLERGADFRMVLNYERIYRIFERSKANGHENVCDF